MASTGGEDEPEFYEVPEALERRSSAGHSLNEDPNPISGQEPPGESITFTDLDTGRAYVVSVGELSSSNNNSDSHSDDLARLQRKAKGVSPLMDIITERENRLSRAHSDNGSDHGSHDDSPSASASSIGASRAATAPNSSSLTASRLLSRSSSSKLKPNRRRPLRWFHKRSRELNAYVRGDGSQQQKCPNRHQDDRHSQNDSSSPHGSNSPAGGDRDVTNPTSSTTTAESADASHSANEIEHLNDQNPSAGFEKVQVNRKIYREFCGVRFTQQIKAHEGPIWAMKFSCDGKYLATAGQDKTVRVWEVSEQYTAETATNGQTANGADEGEDQEKIANLLNAQHDSKTSERPFQREPYRTYTGHTTDVLDLSWSSTQFLISSSMDKTVRLWHLTLDECLRVFDHNDFVTTIEFNPVNDKYFISGSLDGLVRLWYIPGHRVADYVKVNEMVTAATFSPDARKTVAGSYKGRCRFYTMEGDRFEYMTSVDVRNKRGSHSKGRKITGLQFLPGDSKKLLVTSNDSRIRVYDGFVLRCKYKGHRNRNSQIMASFSPEGDFIVCGSEDDKVYMWSTINSYVPMINPIYTGFRKDKHSSYERFRAQETLVTAALFGPEPVRQSASSAVLRQYMQRGAKLEESPTRAARALVDTRLRSTSPTPVDRESPDTTPTRSDAAEAQAAAQSVVDAASSVGQIVLTAGYSGELRIFENMVAPQWI